MKINKLLCKLGFHRWINTVAYQKLWVTGVDTECLDCKKKRHIDYPNEGRPDFSKYNFKVKRRR